MPEVQGQVNWMDLAIDDSFSKVENCSRPDPVALSCKSAFSRLAEEWLDLA